MGQFFAGDYTGAPFEGFGPAHVGALLFILLLNLFLVRYKSAGERTKKKIRWIMAIILWVNEIAWHVWNVVVGKWTIQTMLPLHLCRVLVWGGALMVVTEK